MSETTDSSGPLSPLLDPTEPPTETPDESPGESQSSADVTRQLPAADRTVTDLDALTPETAEAALEATGEIEALDILEVVDVLRSSRMKTPRVGQPPSDAVHASSVPVAPPSSRALEVLETSRLPAVMIAPQGQPHAHPPSSIAPLALDVTPASRGSYASAAWHTPTPPDPRESTVEIARAAGIPSRASRVVVYTAGVTGMCLVAGILGVMLGYSHGPSSTAKPPSLAAPGPVATNGAAPVLTPPVLTPGLAVPRVPVVTSAHEEITEGPILVPAKDAASTLEIADDSLAPAEAAPAVPVPTPLAVKAPAPAPRSAPAAPVVRSTASSNASSTTGVLRLPGSVTGVLIDGVPHKAGGGGLVVSCGRHTVKAPGHPSRLVIIPCGGSAAL